MEQFIEDLALNILGAAGGGLWVIVKYAWWLLAPFVLWPLFRSTWLYWRQELFKRSHEFKMVMYEMRIPLEVRKSPRAMEQVLMALGSLRNSAGDLQEKWWDGEITKWFSFEMVSVGGEVRFFVRGYYKQRALIEAAFFSYYPDVELVEISPEEDYINLLPEGLPEMYQQGYDIWGTEMLLTKEEAYPIRSYIDFESPDEEKQYDPIAAFLEVLGKVKKEEIVGIQILAAPAELSWHKKWQGLVGKLREKRDEGKVTQQMQTQQAFTRALMRTPGETDVLRAVENNLSKPAFNTLIRFVYLSPQAGFYDSFARRGLTGAFNQYAALDLNSFIQNFAVSTRTRIWYWPHIFPKTRNERRKAKLLYNYRRREMPPETFIGRLLTSGLFSLNFASRPTVLNAESLATLFHPPTYIVLTAPHLKRVESKKAAPPAGRIVFGDEKEIEQYL